MGRVVVEREVVRARSHRFGAGLLFVGADVLLYRTIALLTGSARVVLRSWVVVLTVVEMAIDVVTVVTTARWWRSGAPGHARPALRCGAAATLVHAVRVLVFVVGRTGPWVDFDVRPEHRADHGSRWRWVEVVFAAVMSLLGIIGVGIVWRVRRRSSGGGARANAPTRAAPAPPRPPLRGSSPAAVRMA